MLRTLIRFLSLELLSHTRDDELPKARKLVESLDREQRAAVTRQKLNDLNGWTLLGEAVLRKQIPFVRFLLEECYADVEQRFDFGKYNKKPVLSQR